MSHKRGITWRDFRRRFRDRDQGETGFTLVELIIVTAIIPLIVGALSIGLISVFSLQTGVSNRLSDTSDAQTVQASFEPDVQSAAEITTASSTNPQCGTGNQLVGMEWNLLSSGPSAGLYQTVVSYVETANGSANGSVNLVRQYCAGGNTASPVSQSIVSYDLPTSASIALTCTSINTNCSTSAKSQWTSASGIAQVELNVSENLSSYSYQLDAVPAASTSSKVVGSPISSTTSSSCGRASSGAALGLCFVNFSALNNASNYTVATTPGDCLEMSVALPNSFTMYFCISISGAPVDAVPFPTYADAFLGNSGASSGNGSNTPSYFGVAGDPALYQTTYGSDYYAGDVCVPISLYCDNAQGYGLTTISITKITVVNPSGVLATGWNVFGADAESTDAAGNSLGFPERIQFSADKTLSEQISDTAANPVGNAYNSGANITWSNANQTVVFNGQNTTGANKTGTAIVSSLMPTTFTTTMVGTGLEGMSFGVLLS